MACETCNNLKGDGRLVDAPIEDLTSSEQEMIQEIFSEQWVDENGNPAGGVTCGRGFAISWQNGPLGTGEDRKEPNGAFVETLLLAVADRIDFYQSSKFNCESNAKALEHIHAAVEALQSRTKAREARGVEGTHEA